MYIQTVKGILSSILFIPNDLQYFQNHITVHFDLLQQEKGCINQTHWRCTKFTGDYGKILHDHNMNFKIHSVLAYLQPLHIDQHVDQDGDEDLQN